ncbi:MAG: carbon-nitrogen hydrolase family protein [Anaerolineaceae bacterium]|nr:carbon-nitrogen hydrolase family protein [Anaerolineaceae bacterium]
MKICLAQTRPVTGDIAQNIQRHKMFVETAVSHQTDLILFPELSLTGYEPTLAQELAMRHDDPRLDIFQTMADAGPITIAVGVPTRSSPRPGISLLIFQPGQPRGIYTKQFLHTDEEPFFTAGPTTTALIGPHREAALAICYELSVPEHAAAAATSGAQIYLASVAKSARGMAAAHGRLAQIAQTYGMAALMVNSVGLADGEWCAGQSAVWNREGQRLTQLDDTAEGVFIYDTVSQAVILETLTPE